MSKCLTIAAALLFCVPLMAADKERKQYDQPPKMTIDPQKSYTATFVTSKGKIVCELFAKDAPKTVNNFVFLAREKFLRRHHVPPRHQGLHGPGRRPHRHRPRRPRVSLRRRDRRQPPTSTRSALCRWPTPGRTPTARSSSSRTWPRNGWTASTPFSARSRYGQDVVNKIEKGDKLETITIEEK